jgi:dihydrofolate reductase
VSVTIIAAVSDNGVIGKDGKIPWHLPADLKRFKKLTKGHHIVMGRKTWESIGIPLHKRTNVVITSNKDYVADGTTIVHSLEEALALAPDDEETFIIGGERVYRDGFQYADKVELTLVHTEVGGENLVKFPLELLNDWELVRIAPGETHSFHTYERRER